MYFNLIVVLLILFLAFLMLQEYMDYIPDSDYTVPTEQESFQTEKPKYSTDIEPKELTYESQYKQMMPLNREMDFSNVFYEDIGNKKIGINNETIFSITQELTFEEMNNYLITLKNINNEKINDFNNKVCCLLRHNVDTDGNKDIFRHFGEPRADSQDCWIFKSPLKIDTNDLKFTFGTLGCDNMFASILHEQGYELYNPSYDIIVYHLHNIEERNYNIDDRVHGNYCLIQPHHLNETPNITFMEY